MSSLAPPPASRPTLNLSTLNGSNGFQVNGEAEGDHSGISAASAGDINGDGYDDIIIGARFNDVHGHALNDEENNGAAYVVFGSASGIPAELDLAALNGTNGFKLSGEAIGDRTGLSVSSAGDLNGDGFDDMLIGGYRADLHGANSGVSYVVFGTAFGLPGEFRSFEPQRHQRLPAQRHHARRVQRHLRVHRGRRQRRRLRRHHRLRLSRRPPRP